MVREAVCMRGHVCERPCVYEALCMRGRGAREADFH